MKTWNSDEQNKSKIQINKRYRNYKKRSSFTNQISQYTLRSKVLTYPICSAGTSVKVRARLLVFLRNNFSEETMTNQKTETAKIEKYYDIVSARYGADVAILIKLRFAEIQRIVIDELAKDESENTKLVTTQKAISLFLLKLKNLLKKDRELNNMFAEDAELREWSTCYF